MKNRVDFDKFVVIADQKVKEREYWHNKLSGELEKSRFPFDYNIESTGHPGSREMTFNLTTDLFSRLMKLSSRSDHTLHMIFVAALAALLRLYSYNTGNPGSYHRGVILGTPIYKQDMEGDFVNTILPLKNQLEDHMTFKELLLQVKQTVIEALENYSYPMEVLVEELGMALSESGFPLFDVMVLVENIHDKTYIEHIPVSMTFSFLRAHDAIEGKLEYNPGCYLPTTVERLHQHLVQLLRQVLFDVDIRLDRIDILTEKEKRCLLEEFNGIGSGIGTEFTLHQRFEEQVSRHPGRTALRWPTAVGNSLTCSMSYNQLNEKANQLARELRIKGVKPGSIVGILMKPSPDLVISILAVLKAGGAYLPIDVQYPRERVLSILDNSGVSLLLTHSEVIDRYSFTSLQGLKHARVEPYMTGVRPQANFDRLPHPDRSLINFEKYSRYIGHAMVKYAISIQGTRGCPYNCAYCHRTMQKRNVPRSAENIFEEVTYYYKRGVRRFSFVDEIFNLDTQNSMRFFRLLLQHKLEVQLFFPNGMRADRLTREYIDLMVEAGTVNLGLALETASPRLQRLIKKNLDIEKLRQNAEYFCSKYPHVILELFTMHGFPTETQEEAMATLNFIKSLKWVHFPYVFLLKIHPSTDMMKLALESGISREAIERSMTSAFHEIPETLPFPKSFTRQYVARFMDEYFLCKERMLHLLPFQMKIASERELVAKYDNYLPAKINTFDDIIDNVGISMQELKKAAAGEIRLIQDETPYVPDYNALRKSRFIIKKPKQEAFKILLLDLSVLFSTEKKEILHGEVTEPLGLMYLLTYLRQTFEDRIDSRMYKAKIDFDSFDELKPLVCDFKPHLIGIRTLSYFKDFFHKTVSLIKEWGVTAPIIAGGPYGTSDYKLVLQDPHVELTVLKEGELTLAHLVEQMMANNNKLPGEQVLETIKGIAFIKKKAKPRQKKQTRQPLCLDKMSVTLGRHPVENPENLNRPGDLLYLISTSGSTGTPKSVMLEHRNLANLLRFQYTNTNINFEKVLQFASSGFDVSAQEIFSTLLAGGELVFINTEIKNDIPVLFDFIRKNNISTAFLPPAFLKYVFSDPDYARQFPVCLKHIAAAGEQLIVPDLLKRHLKVNGIYLHNHYGPSETHVVTALTLEPTGSIPGRPSIGKPIPGTAVYILDEKHRLMPIGAVGELCISGRSVGRGYYNNKTLTHDKFTVDPFENNQTMYRTGDLARWLPDGNLEFVGRIDQQVKIRGYRIEPGEIETHIKKLTGIADAYVEDIKDESAEKHLCAYIVSREEIKVPEIRDKLSHRLPDYMIPSYFVQLERIPLTPNGKIDKKALPLPRVRTLRKRSAVKNDTEKKLVDAWSEILELDKEKIDVEADFFHLGGHSLKAAVLISKIHRVFDVKVTLGDVFRNATIRGLAEFINTASVEKFTPIKSVEKKEYYPLSSAQKRLFVLRQMEEIEVVYNLPQVVVWNMEIDKDKLEKVFTKLVARHESLRTSFEILEMEPIQKVHLPHEIKFEVDYYDAAGNKTMERQILREFVRPFHLGQVPLMRAALIKSAESKHLLAVDMHHIVSDGTSHNLLVKDFTRLYQGEKLPGLKVQYKDFAQWQNSQEEKAAIKEQEEYWSGEFVGDIPVLALPTDYKRPFAQAYEGNLLRFALSEKQANSLKELAAGEGVTLYMVLLALFNVLLAKITGQEDIVVGTPTAGRKHDDVQDMIGMFVNTLALRDYPAREKTFKYFLKEVKTRTLQAMANQDFQFEDLVEKLNIPRDISRNPIFDVMFILQNQAEQRGDALLRELPISGTYDIETGLSKFDMTLAAQESGDKLLFGLEYCTRLFKPETIDRFINHFKAIIGSVSEEPGKKLSEIEIISGSEKKQILDDFNYPTVEFPADKTLHEYFTQQVERTPDQIALVRQIPNKKEAFGVIQLSYMELNRRSHQLAHLLRHKGVRLDTIVGIMVEPSIEMIIGIMGILKAGGAYLPIDHDHPGERIQYMLTDSSTRFLVTTAGLFEKFEKLSILHCQLLMVSEELPGSRRLNNPPKETNPVNNYQLTINNLQLKGNNLAYILYTSGSTGKPKGVLTEHQSVLNILLTLRETYPLQETDAFLLRTSFTFDVSVTEILGWFWSGGRLVITDKDGARDPQQILDVLPRLGVTHINFVPSLFNAFLDILNKQNIYKLAGLKYIFLAGEALLPGVVNKFITLGTGIPLENLYGPTEATIYSTGYSLQEWQRTDVVPIGRPLRNLHAYILEKHGGLQPVGIPGELCIAGIGTARGYLNKPELTEEKFNHSPHSPHSPIYKTGDLARWQSDGNIEFLGRMDHQVKIRGYRIEPGEVESHLMEHEAIREAVVITRGENNEKYLCAYIVAAEDGAGGFRQIPDSIELRQHLSVTLPDYMIPSYFIQLEEIPLTPNGKIDRNALPKPGITGTGDISDYAAPRDRVEEKLVNLWSQLLGIEEHLVGIDANFFQLGGHSLRATVLLAKIHKTFHVKIPLGMLFKNPSVRGFSTLIKRTWNTTFVSIRAAEKKQFYPLASAQKRLFILQQMYPDSTVYNMPQVIELQEKTGEDRLEAAFSKLIRRHDSLRTSFQLQEGVPIQKIHDDIPFAIRYYEVSRGKFKTGEKADENKIIRDFIRPFVLLEAPLLRVGIIKTTGCRNILMVDMHHIISDGVSLNLLLEDFLDAFAGNELPPMKLQYKDYSEWQNRRGECEYLQKEESYWLKVFEGKLPILQLPPDFEIPAKVHFEGDTVDFSIDGNVASKVRTLVRQTDTTIYMFLLAAFTILLSKYSDQTDIVVGSPITGRPYSDLQIVIGMFVNMLAMRNLPENKKTFTQFLEEVKENAIQAYENQDYQFDDLVSKLGLQGNSHRNPLFNVVFSMQNLDVASNTFKNKNSEKLAASGRNFTFNISRFDLRLIGSETPGSIRLALQYKISLFKRATIEKMAKHFTEIVEQVVENEASRLEEITISHDLKPGTNIRQTDGIDFNF